MKFIQYSLAGKVVEQYSCDFDQLKDNLIGEKVRVTMDNGKICVGFWDTFLGQGKVQTAEISQYDLDEKTSKLRSFNSIVTFFRQAELLNLKQFYIVIHAGVRDRLTSLNFLNQ